MDADSIVQQTLLKYSRCSTYSDEGCIESAGFARPGILFKTDFVRPSRFRFEWRSWHPFLGRIGPEYYNVIGADDIGAYEFYDWSSGLGLSYKRRCKTLALAIAGATGISQGASFLISSLIIPLVVLRHRQEMLPISDAELLPMEVGPYDDCYHIRCGRGENFHYEFWINRHDFSLLKVKTEFSTTTKYKGKAALLFKTAAILVPHICTEYVFNRTAFDQPIAEAVFSCKE
jgi:hypothetical protein